MNSHIFKVLQLVSQQELQLDSLRQLLCQEIQFVPLTAYTLILQQTATSNIDIYSLISFLQNDCKPTALQSLIKFYSNNELSLNLTQFENISIAREDRLLNKLTREREVSEEHNLPSYLLDYLRKIWKVQGQLHGQIELLKQLPGVKPKHFDRYKMGQWVNEELLREQFVKVAEEKECQICPKIAFELVLRYLSRGLPQPISFAALISLFVSENCNTIKQFLVQQSRSQKIHKSKKPKTKDPYLHSQLHKRQSGLFPQCFCFRQLKSVENHLNRNHIPSEKTIKNRMKAYSKDLERQLSLFFKYLKKIIKIEVQINKLKQEVGQYECNFEGLFQQINHSKSGLIPSELHHYLCSLGVFLLLPSLFILFKKHGDPITGKITSPHFCRAFTTLPQSKLQMVDSKFREAAINCLIGQIQLQLQIQKLKRQLIAHIELRQIFDGIDVHRRANISCTDFQVCCKRITGHPFSSTLLVPLRQRLRLNPHLNYDQFMFQMLPRIRQKSKCCY